MELFQAVMVALICVNLAYLALTRLRALARLTAVQGALLALVPLLFAGPAAHGHALFLSLAVLAIKGVGFPWLLARTLSRLEVNPVVEPYVGFNFSLLAGVAGLLFSLWLETRLPFPPDLFPPLLFPAALTTIFTGLTLVIVRRKALTQVIGYLAAENGIFRPGFGLARTVRAPGRVRGRLCHGHRHPPHQQDLRVHRRRTVLHPAGLEHHA